MKKLISIAAFLFITITSFAGGNDKVVKDTTINKTVYHLYEGSKGGRYIIVTSKKGNQYKKYFKH